MDTAYRSGVTFSFNNYIIQMFFLNIKAAHFLSISKKMFATFSAQVDLNNKKNVLSKLLHFESTSRPYKGSTSLPYKGSTSRPYKGSTSRPYKGLPTNKTSEIQPYGDTSETIVLVPCIQGSQQVRTVLTLVVNHQNTQLNAETKNQTINLHFFKVLGLLYSLIICG